MLLRVILALCVVLFSTLCGRAMADGVRRRALSLQSISESLRRLRVRMTGMFEPVSGALAQSGCPLFEAVSDGMRDGASAGEAWRAVSAQESKRGGLVDCLTNADISALTTLFDGLGQSGREEQEILLSAAVGRVEALRAEAEARMSEAERLYARLGLLIGLMLALIVI